MAAVNLSQDATQQKRENMPIVIVGHVDHGKSTIIGRLLADTGSLPEGKLEAVRETCRRQGRPFAYAFLLDALKEEQAQGITIAAARCFFKTEQRNYIIVDAPGHIEFLKNMVTGAARAEAALLVIDATVGVKENSRRHGYMLSLLGIKQVAVLINKLDLVAYSEALYKEIAGEYGAFLARIGIEPAGYIPVSGQGGDNIAYLSAKMPWYGARTVLETLDAFTAEENLEDKPFRLPVQGVYKFTRDGDNRRIVAGTVAAGRLKVGDEVIFYPSGKTSRVQSIEGFNEAEKKSVGAGYATGFTLTEQIYVTRGELATLAGQTKPGVTSRIRANLFWLGREPLQKGKTYLLKLGTARIGAVLEKVVRVIDASTLAVSEKERLQRHDVGECILKLDRDMAFDPPNLLVETGRFVIVDRYEICGGGIIEEALEDEQWGAREKVHLRHKKWEKGYVEEEERAERNNQRATLVLVTGPKEARRKELAKALEKQLFTEGKQVYFLSMGNLLYGIDADLKAARQNDRQEHFRRLAEVANIMLDAGLMLIVSLIELNSDDMRLLTLGLDRDKIEVVWLGDEVTTAVAVHLQLSENLPEGRAVAQVKAYLQKKGIIFKAW